MENYNNQESYNRAKQRVEDLKGFYGNLVSYILVNLFLVFINLKYSPNELWFFWPMLGWGIGVFFHAMKVFNFFPFFGKEWEEKKMKEYIEQEKDNTNKWQ
jgi:2TM domain